MASFEVAGITVHLNTAPPVYAPGGPVAFTPGLPDGVTLQELTAVERAATEQGAVLLVVQCPVVEEEKEALLLGQGYNFASSWYFGPLGSQSAAGHPDSNAILRTATATDVPRILEIGELKREQYEGFSPIFWKKAPTPRQEFAPYLTSQVESEQNVALVAEVDGEIRGYCIAQCRNLAEGYVDDYAIADPSTDWPTIGSLLLAEASQRAAAKGVATFAIVTGHADTPKRAVAESLGFALRKNWLVNPLG